MESHPRFNRSSLIDITYSSPMKTISIFLLLLASCNVANIESSGANKTVKEMSPNWQQIWITLKHWPRKKTCTWTPENCLFAQWSTACSRAGMVPIGTSMEQQPNLKAEILRAATSLQHWFSRLGSKYPEQSWRNVHLHQWLTFYVPKNQSPLLHKTMSQKWKSIF